MLDGVNHRTGLTRRMADDVLGSRGQLTVAHPAHVRHKLTRHERRELGADDHVAAGDIKVVGKTDRDRPRRLGDLELPVDRLDTRDHRAVSGRQHQDVHPGTELT